ncbi:hypothetical protein BT96DRAFT_841958 [Gymnopus androsaceus JB14]|uniref:Uncharacterized protein n=1 Tax=Gymnopus androsaceus JB14 TaxID=1447944 RepID=A0A6A4GG58_9AGAR|nr:hypothetical protein BT96DRAFT_841958 [Gymnopus androsaceus JB14]
MWGLLGLSYVYLTKLLPAWNQIVADFQLPPKKIPCDVRPCWNLTFDMINMALQYKTALNSFINDSDHGLSHFALSSMEWAILENLRDILQDATLFCSHDTATLALVIPAMDKLDSVLASSVLRKVDKQIQFTAPVKISLLAAKKTLNCYYAATDNSRVYQLAMGA